MEPRRLLLDEIERETAQTAGWTGRAGLSARVRDALLRVRREAFVPPHEASNAYCNAALPIGYGQTISQPFVVAIMTELLDLSPDAVVLEVGTGSGYQAAVLAALARQVYTIEVVPELAAGARAALHREGFANVELRVGDGARGWPEHAPFDAIIVTAAARKVPPALLDQLKRGGRLIAPVGAAAGMQRLMLVEKDASGMLSERDVLSVAFVPLVKPEEP